MADSATTKPSQKAGAVITSSGTSTPSASNSFQVVKNLLPNILDKYASYNYNLSLSVLDANEFNNASYKKSGAKGPFLAYSANQQPENRVQTEYGKFDFFIENLSINHISGLDKTTGNSNATGFSFKVIEPYSMGLFFVALQQASFDKNYKNYIEAPMLLTVEFKGHIDPERTTNYDTVATRHYPLKLMLIEFKVTSNGCEYDVSAYPYNESAFEKSKITLSTDLSIQGTKVEDMIKSAEDALNAKVKDQKSGELVKKEDKYVIEFPDLPDGKPNPIKTADMGFKSYKDGNTPFAKDNFVYENGVYKRGNLEIRSDLKQFQFSQGTDISNLINQVILMSEYGRTALNDVSDDGFVNWWRIATAVEILPSDDNLSTTGVTPKKIIYKITPYRVSVSPALPANTQLTGAEIDKKLVVKEYNYIYSGINTSIIEFDIQFKAGFYTPLPADGSQNNKDKKLSEQLSNASNPSEIQEGTQVKEGQSAINKKEVPTRVEYGEVRSALSGMGGGRANSPTSLAARQFHDAISSGLDMIVVDMTILGDPYYLGDSGMGNNKSEPTTNKYLNADGSMAWENGEIHLLLNFRTPVDIDLTSGLFDFGRVVKVPQFSGLYRVNMLQSNFNKGKFTQTLKMLRLRNQNSEQGDGKPATTTDETEQAS